MPLVSWGPVTFTSGYAPTSIDGPKRTAYVVEHQMPAREGGIVEYIGSQQPTYTIKGFLAPRDDKFPGTAVALLSGASYYGITPDTAMQTILGLRGSGALLLRLESTWTQFSGYSVFYENDFFYAGSITFAQQAGYGYPFYPYSLDLRRASTTKFGNSSGTSTLAADNAGGLSGAYLSGYIRLWTLISGQPSFAGQVAGLGAYVLAVNGGGGNMRVAIYSGLAAGATIVAQSPSQPVVSGWNYFPLNPTFTAQSGYGYILALMSDTTGNGAYALAYSDQGSSSTISSTLSGYPYLSGFPTTIAQTVSGYGNISGYALDIVMVCV